MTDPRGDLVHATFGDEPMAEFDGTEDWLDDPDREQIVPRDE